MSGKVTGAGGKGFSAEIRIEGLDQTIAVLRSVAPEVLKRLRREFREAAAPVAAEAAAAGAATGHTLSYKTQISSSRTKPGMKIRAADRDSAIFEFAGTRGLSRSGGPITPQGAAMIAWLDTFGSPGRFLWEAWDSHAAGVEAEIKRAMEDAEHELQAKLTSLGEVF